ncbi:Glycosyltransferase involved in cell wall bisynthesis [Lutibacter agarilyticus]|uniref:Glycosyltransferase involved in cell wall bisynthesis n=1 Tax=Lutibacter agarilyticus TaxID=1109740 RepID=A0A238YZB6_9FLAO|nr:glycosyltransferase family A protein [Lutibacter agarilyticus]SNR76024.1 Glycosyltransferase involved in cell wall bisynthesis [Lutibacter agarilyticus]
MVSFPLITVVLTTYNRSHLIGETLDSIIGQTYENWKCIIIDDNSKDNTKEVVLNYLEKDNRFQYYLKGNKYVKGLSASRNMGMDLIESLKLNTKYIQFFDDDDIMHPQKFEIQVKEFTKYKKLDASFFIGKSFYNNDFNYNIEYYSSVDSTLVNDIAKYFFIKKYFFTAQVLLIRYNTIIDKRFNEELFYAEEWEFFNKLFFLKKVNISFIENTPLFYHRKHNLSITSNLYNDANNIVLKSLKKSFRNVYKLIKEVGRLNDSEIFYKLLTHAIYHDGSMLEDLRNDLKLGTLQNKYKERGVVFLLKNISFNKKIISRLIGAVLIKI